MKFNKNLIIASMLLAPVGSSLANVHFNGFASVHMSSVDSDGGGQPFPEYVEDGEVSFKNESLFAVQASSDLGEGLSATIQLMAEGQDDFDVDARWAYIAYQINDEHQIKAGRLANPIFYQSEYEKVGYAHNYARLPKAVYLGFDFSTVEGVSLNSDFYLGDYTLSTRAMLGSWNGEVFIPAARANVPLGFKNMITFGASVSADWWTVFAGGFIAEMKATKVDEGLETAVLADIDVTTLSDTDVSAFKNGMAWDGKDSQYVYYGFNIDYNNILVDYEAATYSLEDSSQAETQAWYLSAGYRVNDELIVTLYSDSLETESDFSVINSVSNQELKELGNGFIKTLAFREFEGNGLTVRYDFHPSAALKADYYMGEDTRDGSALARGVNIGDFTMFSLGVDLVF